MRKIIVTCVAVLLWVGCAAEQHDDCCSGCLGDGSSRASGYVCRDGYCVCGEEGGC